MDINKTSMIEYEVKDFIELMNKLKFLIKNKERLEDSPESLKKIYDGIKTPFFEVSINTRKPEKEIEEVMFDKGIMSFEIYNKNDYIKSVGYRFEFTRGMDMFYFSSFYDVLRKVELELLSKYPFKLIMDNYEIIDKDTFSDIFDKKDKVTLEDCIEYANFINKITDFSYMQSHDMHKKARSVSMFENSMNKVGLNREILSEILGFEPEKYNFIFEYSTARILANLTEDDKYMLMLNGILPD